MLIRITNLSSALLLLYASTAAANDVTVTLFQWDFESIAHECTTVLGPKSYGYVEISPPQEHIQGDAWWTSYQPVSYQIAGRLGSEEQLVKMIGACHKAGVKVIVDAVINHMTQGDGIGTAGSVYTKYHYPGYYQDWDFHGCRRDIADYSNRFDVQECELGGLADLNTASDYVQQTIANYLNHLIELGVDGFRIDAAKHMAASDLVRIKAKLTKQNLVWVQEVIYGQNEAIQPDEYLPLGTIDEFRYGRDLKTIFETGNLAELKTMGSTWGYLPSDKARVFIDNWDTERNGSTLTYRHGALYTLANVFMLAYPYGQPNVYSSYEFDDFSAGAPQQGHVDHCFDTGWKCQHYWLQIANMVAFHNAVGSSPVTHWWSNGHNAIAFGRGSYGYVVINHEAYTITKQFQTALPPGRYCDVQHALVHEGHCDGQTYWVNQTGQFSATVQPNDALALCKI